MASPRPLVAPVDRRRTLRALPRPAAVIGVIAAITTIAARRRARRLAAVALDLRTPQVWLPVSLRGPTSLAVARRLLPRAPSAPLVDGVTPRTEIIGTADERPDVRVVIYEPPRRPRPSGALVWIHGGGYVMGDPEQNEGLCSRLAVELGIFVASVDYRLAPEHPFPAGLDDCYVALAWVHARAAELGIDPARVAVGGASAGGGLAAALAQMAVDRGGPAVCFQLLEYPMLDDRTARRRGLDALFWTMRSNRWAWAAYLGHPLDRPELRRWASPSRRTDLSGLPPAWIGVGDLDLFHDECVDYAARLSAAAVPCQLHVEPGMYHGADALVLGAVSMQRFLDRLVNALGDAVGGEPDRDPVR